MAKKIESDPLPFLPYNYAFAKRQRDAAKKQRKEEKRKRKLGPDEPTSVAGALPVPTNEKVIP